MNLLTLKASSVPFHHLPDAAEKALPPVPEVVGRVAFVSQPSSVASMFSPHAGTAVEGVKAASPATYPLSHRFLMPIKKFTASSSLDFAKRFHLGAI